MTIKLQAGRRYRITYRMWNQKYMRYMIADFLGEDTTFGRTELVLSLRPEAGTTRMDLKDIIDVTEVDKRTPIVIEKVIR